MYYLNIMKLYTYISVFTILEGSLNTCLLHIQNLSWILNLKNIFHPWVQTICLYLLFLVIFRKRKGEGRKEGEREREREKHQCVVQLIDEFIGCFLYVPWPEIKPTTLVHGDNTLTNRATRPGPCLHWEMSTFTNYNWSENWRMFKPIQVHKGNVESLIRPEVLADADLLGHELSDSMAAIFICCPKPYCRSWPSISGRY